MPPWGSYGGPKGQQLWGPRVFFGQAHSGYVYRKPKGAKLLSTLCMCTHLRITGDKRGFVLPTLLQSVDFTDCVESETEDPDADVWKQLELNRKTPTFIGK